MRQKKLEMMKKLYERFHILIPARFNAKRLPGKPLLDILGKTLIQRVYEQATRCGAETVTVATDNERIYQTVKHFGGKVCMTDANHSCGTERLSEATHLIGLKANAIVVNIQCDEPLIPKSAIQKTVMGLVEDPNATVSTLAIPITTRQEIFDPNVVKVVLSKNKQALLFSRAPIPWHHDAFQQKGVNFKKIVCYRHIGLYAYRTQTLQQFANWTPTAIEKIECLEQLRIMWHGGKIHVSLVNHHFPQGVDTPADLKRMRAWYIKNNCTLNN